MDPDPSNIIKIIQSLKKRGFEKEANVLEEIFAPEPPHKKALVTECPICGPDPKQADPNCVLCEGSGELVSVVPDDDEDQRVLEELKLK